MAKIVVSMLGTGWTVERAKREGNVFTSLMPGFKSDVHAQVFDGPVNRSGYRMGQLTG